MAVNSSTSRSRRPARASAPKRGDRPEPESEPGEPANDAPAPAAAVRTPRTAEGPALGRLADFRPLSANPNAHTERGLALLETAIQQDGFTAPMTASADGVILDGNARLETVAHALPADPIVLRHDGTRPIIAIRTDIPSSEDPRARRIAVAANRIAEADLAWDRSVLSALAQDPQVAALWTPDEFALLHMLAAGSAEAPTLPSGDRQPQQQMSFVLHDDQAATVTAALDRAKQDGGGVSSLNSNENGNALAFVCRWFLDRYGRS